MVDAIGLIAQYWYLPYTISIISLLKMIKNRKLKPLSVKLVILWFLLPEPMIMYKISNYFKVWLS